MTSEGDLSEKDQGAEEPLPAGMSGAPRLPLHTRIFEWFWQRKLTKQLNASKAEYTVTGLQYLSRARLSAEVALKFVQDREAAFGLSTVPLAFEHYRQAVYWSLLAAAENGILMDSVGERIPAASHLSLDELWERARPTMMDAEIPGRAEELWSLIGRSSFKEYWDNSPATPLALEDTEAFVQDLMRRAAPALPQLREVRIRRLSRVGLPLLFVLGTTAALKFAEHNERVVRQTSVPWRTSSRHWQEKGCTSPDQACNESRFFFCTNEQTDAWIEFDIGSESPIHGIRIVNRIDGPFLRAVPLLVEVSKDRVTWKTVARRDKSFKEWSADFKADARWVRLRVPKKTYFHLKQVSIVY